MFQGLYILANACCLLILSTLVGVQWYLSVVILSIFPYMLISHSSILFYQVFIQICVHFLLGLSIFLVLSYKDSLLWICPLSDRFSKHFLLGHGLSFHFLNSVFQRAEVLHFDRVPFISSSICSFVCVCVLPRNHCLSQVVKISFYVFF